VYLLGEHRGCAGDGQASEQLGRKRVFLVGIAMFLLAQPWQAHRNPWTS